jgi:hypothetical protein
MHVCDSPKCFQLGSFGGGYFRTIKSAVTKRVHERAWEEFPLSWFDGLDISKQVASEVYNPSVNRYGVRSGKTMGSKDSFGLLAWETSGWIVEQDPFGWFQWYCRFYLGRRSPDDDRQIGRWAAICGSKGRWKRNLIARCVREGKIFDDASCAPVVRQTLQHWAYCLTAIDFSAYCAQIAAGARTAFIPASSMLHIATHDEHDAAGTAHLNPPQLSNHRNSSGEIKAVQPKSKCLPRVSTKKPKRSRQQGEGGVGGGERWGEREGDAVESRPGGNGLSKGADLGKDSCQTHAHTASGDRPETRAPKRLRR